MYACDGIAKLITFYRIQHEMITIMSFALHVAIHIICYQSNWVLRLGKSEQQVKIEEKPEDTWKEGETVTQPPTRVRT